MKQTNNAITFLAASYRAVFEKAYLKGFASSCALLAVASPYAYAASSDVTWGTTADTAADVEISDDYPGSGGSTIPDTAYVKNLTISAETSPTLNFKNLNVDGIFLSESTTSNPVNVSGSFKLGGGLQVTGAAILSLNDAYIQNGITVGTGKTNNNGSTSSLTFTNGFTDQTSDVYVGGDITVNGAEFKVQGNTNYHTQVIGKGSTSPDVSISSQLIASTATITIDRASVAVDGAKITSGSTINIQNKAPYDGNSNTADVYTNYSNLYMGMGGGGGEASTAQISNSTVNIGDRGLLGAAASLVLDQGSQVNFSGAKKGQDTSLLYAQGELAGKALLRAKTATVSDGSKIEVTKNNNGGLLVQNFTLEGDNSAINVQKDGELYISGRNEYSSNFPAGATSGAKTTNTFEKGSFDFKSGTINNSGTVVLGALSYNASGSTQTGLRLSKYLFTQNGGTFNNDGTLQIGEPVPTDRKLLGDDTVKPYTEAPGTTYYGMSGSLNNAANSKIFVNQGSSLQLRGTNLNNQGNIEVQSGAEFSITANSKLDNNSGSINIASGANVTIRIDALGSYASHKISDTETVDTADISSLGNFTNSGTITLDKVSDNKAVFKVTPEQLQNVLGAQLETGTPANETRIKLSNDTHLRFEDDLNLGAKSLAQFSGGADSSLQTTGTLNYTVADKTTTPTATDDLHGVALIGKTLNFIGTPNTDNKININGSGSDGTNAVFVATNTVKSQLSDNQDAKSALSFTNAELRLDKSALDLGFTQDESAGAVTEQAEEVTQGNVEVDLTFNSGAKLTVDDGLWKANNVTLNSGASLELNGSTTTDALGNVTSKDQGLTVDTLQLNPGSNTRLTAGQLIAKRLLGGSSGGSFTATAGSIVKINGDGKKNPSNIDFYGGNNVNIINSSIYLNNADDSIGLTLPDASGSFATGTGFSEFKAEAADVYLDLTNFGSGSGSITTTQANELFDSLVDGTGLLHLTGINTDLDGHISGGEVDFGTIAPDKELTLNYDTETTRNTILSNVNGKVTGGWQAIKMSGTGPLQVKENGTLGLYGTTTSDTSSGGNFVEDSSGNVAGVNLTSGSTLMLQASGSIGEITGESGSTLALGNASDVKVVDASGSAANVNVNKLLSNGKLQAKDVTVNQADLTQGAQLTATTFTVNDNLSATGSKLNLDNINLTSGSATFNGSQLQVNKDFTAAGQLNFNNAATANIKGTLNAQQGLTLVGDSFLDVGTLIASGDVLVGEESGANNLSSSGKLEAERISLNGNTLILDPDFGQQTATVFAQNIGAIPSNTTDPSGGSVSSSVMNADGSIVVGRNAALGLGGNANNFYSALQKQQTSNGSLSANGIGSFLYINRGNINLGDNKLILGTDDIAKLTSKLSGTASIYLGQNTAMQITDQAFQEVSSGEAVFNDLDSSKSISSDNATLIVPNSTKTQDFGKLFGSEVQLEAGSSIQVTTENGLFTAVIDSAEELHGSGSIMNPSDDAREILSDLSNPTYDFVMNVLSERTTHYATEEDYKNNKPITSTGDNTDGTGNGTGTGDTGNGTGTGNGTNTTASATASNGISVIDNSTGYQFIKAATDKLNARPIEQSARMATLGGVMQVAMQASSTTTEAINGRLGSGQANGQNGLLNQGRTGRIWATPVYKNFSSDDFSANGLSYGPDIDLYGAAMGAEASLSNGFTAGVMFNIGTGSADGSGIGAGINNDFSYYGFGLYTNLNLSKNFNVAADLSYTTIDNDLESHAGINSVDLSFDKLQATTDAEVLSMGVSAQYVFKNRDLMIMPHAGLRYDRIKFDGYNTKVDNNFLAHTTGATADVFSIPVGVSIFKDIRDGNWTYRPSADFSLTTNFGDDSVKNNTSFDGIYGSSINYETEFIDPLVYSASFGFTAVNRNLSFGASVGYTGSANTDEFNIGLNGRWLF